MKRYLAVVLLLCPVILTGCIDEDWSLCEAEDNCILRFRYLDQDGKDIFTDHIKTVDLYLFGQDGKLFERYRCTESDLSGLQGVILSIPAGDYFAVAWGNITDGSVKSLNTIADSELQLTENSIPVFHAPTPQVTGRWAGESDTEPAAYLISVPAYGTIEKDLTFRRACRNINVFIKDYDDPLLGTDPPMIVDFRNISWSYNFFMRVLVPRRDYMAGTIPTYTPAGIIPGASVMTTYQEIEDDIAIHITTMDGRVVHAPVNLREFLLGEGIAPDPLSLHDINILITFSGGEVTLTTTDWQDNEVGPVW